MPDNETARNIAERKAINRLQEVLYNEILPFVVWKDVPECKERILAALVEFQEELEAIAVLDEKTKTALEFYDAFVEFAENMRKRV